MDRRGFLRLAGLLAAGSSAACTPLYKELSGVPAPLKFWVPEEEPDFRSLSRLTYGPRIEERRQVAKDGLPAWIEDQLTPGHLDDEAVNWRLRNLESLSLEADVLADWEPEDAILQLKQGSLLRKIYSRRQLYEVMVEFWTDHFNISVQKGDCWFLKSIDDRQVVRAHALGNFRDILWASAHSPAMLVYLDNQANDRLAPNENYAREVLELHTLGVEAGYSQNDVMELARCLTGWTVKEHFWKGQFTFEEDRHDPGVKTVLGHRIEPAGQAEAEFILEKIALHPATATHLATKLVRRFVDDQPAENQADLVRRTAETFLDTQGDIQATLRRLLMEAGDRSKSSLGPKFKRPLDFLVSALRMLNADTDGGQALSENLNQMGQSIFEWPTPDGPPDQVSFWANNLIRRWQFALALVGGQIPGTLLDIEALFLAVGAETPASALEAFSRGLFGGPLAAEVADVFMQTISNEATGGGLSTEALLVAGLVASPAFQWR